VAVALTDVEFAAGKVAAGNRLGGLEVAGPVAAVATGEELAAGLVTAVASVEELAVASVTAAASVEELAAALMGV